METKALREVCYFCSALAINAAYVDDNGIGWLATCLRCDEDGLADDYAERQRQAKKEHDK